MTHTITPPPEVVDRLFMIEGSEEDRIIAAYRAGADRELEACCQALYSRYVNTGLAAATAATVSQEMSDWLRAARRPKPPSLKEQALNDLEDIPTHDDEGRQVVDLSNIRRALEALPQ
jgi:hypothetical protein